MAWTIAAWGWATAAVAALVGIAACSAGGDGDPILAGTATTVGVGGGGTGGMSDCSEQPCKLVPPQCGCADGERCTLAGAPLTRACLPVGDKNLTESCGECVAGAMCIDNGSGAPPLCHQFCESDADCMGGLCILDIGGGLGKLCTHACDPIAQTGCADPVAKCDILHEVASDRWYTLCVGVGPGVSGTMCTLSSQCAAGLGCVPVVGMMIETLCVEWCDVNNPVCPVGTCEPFDPPVTIGAIEYGVCIP